MKEINKKIYVIGILTILLGMSVVTSINAESLKNVEVTIEEKDDGIETQDVPVYDLIIITPKYFARSLQPLVCHKNKVGVKTRLVTLREVYTQSYWGRDKAEQIKFYIKDAIENWGIRYVLLVGGKVGQSNRWYCPVRYVYTGNDWESHILSDMYFADIYDSEGNFSDWDSDGDGIYSEFFIGEQPEDKFIDLDPDIAVGRLPCRYRFEVKLAVKRIIKYEKTAYGKSWFDDMVVIAGDTYIEKHNSSWVGYEGEFYGDMAIENMSDFNPIKLYTSDGTLTGGRDILKALNKGCGFVYFVGHGSPMSWATHFPNDENRTKSFGTTQIARLRNMNRQPVCIVSGCHNSQFDVSVLNYFNKTKRYHMEWPPECWSWQMTRKIGGGSIATIGCAALGHTKEDKPTFAGGINELEVEFFKQYGQNEVDILGDTWKAALSWYVDTYPIDWNSELGKDEWVDLQVPQTWILFGDPSLKIGGYPPQ